MKKIIVTTSINAPTEALIAFSKKQDWQLIVVGDKKTPHAAYANLNCLYMHPDEQHKKYPELSEYIGWNKVERRSIGFVEAYNQGADIMATVDDDNIPYPHWGENLLVGKKVQCLVYENAKGVFDPLSVTNKIHLWHRGYPLQLLKTRHSNKGLGQRKVTCLVQADLWNGEPDIDAVCRWTIDYAIDEKFTDVGPYSCTGCSPFNSQNTFIHRDVLPDYMMPIGPGRVHDIWAAYLLEKKFPNCVIYNRASVYQRRNYHSLVEDYITEKDTYHLSLACIKGNLPKKLWQEIQHSYALYQQALR